MLDFKMETFLTLCETMSYTRAAERLCITQPAVTQQIRHLEEYYGGRLFSYHGKTLSMTERGRRLELAAKSLRHSSEALRERLVGLEERRPPLRLGATKTIGDYVIPGKLCCYLAADPERSLSLTVDNTRNLLAALEAGTLDLALIEGYFDKARYDFRTLRRENFTGICREGHRFAGRRVGFEELFEETLIVREPGSGTRAIFEAALLGHNHSLDSFAKTVEIGSFPVILSLVEAGLGFSFLYRSVLKESKRALRAFEIRDTPIFHEFNFVFLRDNLLRGELEAFIAAPQQM